MAASGALSGKQKKEVEKIAKKFAGKAGPQGPAGGAGAKGDPGLEGDQGPEGKQGKDGKAGKDGESGKSVVVGSELTGTANCSGQGGATVEKEGTPASKQFVCNGKEGSPWTAGGTLPPGATEVGNWFLEVGPQKIKVDVEGTTEEIDLRRPAEGIVALISFPIRYEFSLRGEGCGEPELTRTLPCHVHYGAPNSGGAFVSGTGLCPGTSLKPEAAPGELCVYESSGSVSGTTEAGIKKNPGGVFAAEGATMTGAYITFAENSEPARGYGSYAITGCSNTSPNPAIKCPSDS